MDTSGGMQDLSKIPSQPAPPGMTSNFVNPPSRIGSLIAASAALITLSTIFTILRLYTRLILTRIFGLSDRLLLAGYCFAVTNTAFAILETFMGLGRHAWNVPLGGVFSHQLKCIWWQIKLHTVSLGRSKLAILGLYPKISPSRTFRVSVWVLVELVTSCTISTLLWSILGYLPISNSWSFQAAIAGKCLPQVSFLAFTGATNVATDLAILTLPVMMMRHLTLPKKKKLGIAIVLATGSLASVISIVRMILSLRNMAIPDTTYKIVDLVVWSSAELHAVVICGCMPTLRPILRLVFGKKTLQNRNDVAGGMMAAERKKHAKLNAHETTVWDVEANDLSNESQDCKYSAGEDDVRDRVNPLPIDSDLRTHKSS